MIYDLKAEGRDMSTRAERKPQSPRLARQTGLGVIPRALRVSVVNIRAKQSQFRDCGLRIADWGEPPSGLCPPSCGQRNVRNKPNSARPHPISDRREIRLDSVPTGLRIRVVVGVAIVIRRGASPTGCVQGVIGPTKHDRSVEAVPSSR